MHESDSVHFDIEVSVIDRVVFDGFFLLLRLTFILASLNLRLLFRRISTVVPYLQSNEERQEDAKKDE
jgi:hypothetical protein